MKRIFLSALIGVGIVALIFQLFSGRSSARTADNYPLVCRGGPSFAPFTVGTGIPGVTIIGFTFTRGKKPAGEGLAAGECSWVDRAINDDEPNSVSQHKEAAGTPETGWYEELHSPDKYWTFMVRNNGAGQLIATSARPNAGVDDKTTTAGFTPSADGVESFATYHYFDDKCDSWIGFPDGGEAAPGTNHVGYINHWHDGGLFGCTSQFNTSFRGTVWFDLNEIFSKPPVPTATKAILTFKKILAIANDANGKPITRICHDVLQAASEDWMKDHPYSSLPYDMHEHFVAAGAFDFSAPIDSCPPAGCSIDVTDVVNGWILHPELRYGFVMIGEDEVFLAKLHPKTNDACETRYGDFRLTVNYTYDGATGGEGSKKPIVDRYPFPGGDKTGFAPVNLALKRPATQSSTIPGGEAYRAVDGNTDGVAANGSVAYTNIESQAWWEVDLGSIRSIQNIRVWNRVEAPGRTSDFYVFVSDEPFKSTDLGATKSQPSVRSFFVSGPCAYPTEITVGKTGRYVRVQLSGTNYLQLAEVEVLAPPK